MYNILIVDDEPMICKGLATIIQSSDLPVHEIYIASNGFEALDFIRLDQIHLVLTDIQMEKMNGIELLETISLEKPNIPVIILSAYGEFEYAQKALRYGAKEYIVKPIHPPQLIDVVKETLFEHETKLKNVAESSLSRKFSFTDFHDRKHHMLSELIYDPIKETEMREVLRYLGYEPTGSAFSALVVKLSLNKGGLSGEEIASFRDRNLLKYACLNIIEETLLNWDNIVFYSNSNTMTVILQFSEEDTKASIRENELTMIAQLIHNHLYNYLHIENIVGISSIKHGVGSWNHIFREAVRALESNELHPDHHVFFIEDIGQDNNNLIKHAKAYIDENFRRKGLKLQDIAETVHLSPNYLSYLFKKVMGINIWDYVTKLRMEEGRRLILSTDKRRYEVSEEIGYESPEHFSKIFKKYFGYSLSEIKR